MWTRDGQALVLDVGVTGADAAQQSGQVALEGRQPVRGAGPDHPAVGGAPALVAVLAEQVQVLAGVADRVADGLEPAEVERLAGRATGDHRDGEHLRGEVDEHAARVGVDVGPGRVVDDRGEGPVEVETDDALGRDTDQGGVPPFTLGRREVHGSTQPRAGRVRARRSG